jgi:hypothetical protein
MTLPTLLRNTISSLTLASALRELPNNRMASAPGPALRITKVSGEAQLDSEVVG